jgi:Replication-relaxation
MSGRTRSLHLRERLSSRDLAILTSLQNLRFMTGQQVRRLHFAAGIATTQARKTRAALQRLHELRLIVRLNRRVGGLHAGSEGYVVGLSGWGYAVLDLDNPNPQRHRRVTDTKPAFQDHVLAVSELHVLLVEHDRTTPDDLVEFAAEPAAWRHFTGIGGQRITLKPDAYLRLGIGDVELMAFLEQDMATESLPTIARKLGVYVDYWRSGLEQQLYDVFPFVLWLVPTRKRLGELARAIQRVPNEARHLFKVALHGDAIKLLTQLSAEGGVS